MVSVSSTGGKRRALHPKELPLWQQLMSAPCNTIPEYRVVYPHADGDGMIDTHTHPCVHDQVMTFTGIPTPYTIERSGTTFSVQDISETVISNDREMRVIAAPHYLFVLTRRKGRIWPRSLPVEYQDHKESMYRDALRATPLPAYAESRPDTVVTHQAITTRLYLAAAQKAMLKLAQRHNPNITYTGYRISGKHGILEHLTRQAMIRSGRATPKKTGW